MNTTIKHFPAHADVPDTEKRQILTLKYSVQIRQNGLSSVEKNTF
jgi:hypothetical protein